MLPIAQEANIEIALKWLSLRGRVFRSAIRARVLPWPLAFQRRCQKTVLYSAYVEVNQFAAIT